MERFEPAVYSVEENQFLIDHAGEAPSVAFYHGVPAGVNPKAVRPVLQKIYEYQELQKNHGVEWSGVSAIKESCKHYIESIAKWEDARKRGVPYPPTMYEWDFRGRPHRGAVGSDAHMVRTYFGKSGERVPLGVDFQTAEPFTPDWIKARKPVEIPKELIFDDEKGLIMCPICNSTETYEAGVQSKRNMAVVRMNKHLLNPKSQVEEHRILHGSVVSGA